MPAARKIVRRLDGAVLPPSTIRESMVVPRGETHADGSDAEPSDDTTAVDAPAFADGVLHAPVWHVCIEDGEPVGPVSAHQIARGIRAGKVPSHATVRREADVFWSDLLDVPELLAALKEVSKESDVPPPSAPPPLLAKQFLVWVDDSEPVGPVSADQIARGIRAGKVPSHASVQRVDDIFATDVLDAPEVIEALKRL